MYGYAGKILHVDLTTGTITVEEPPETFYRRYLGGNGFVGYYLLKLVPTGTDALGPDNVLIMADGTFTGVPISGAGRSTDGAKSPLTGGYGSADVGGFFGAELKRAGYDAVVVRGKAAKPVYIWIRNGKVEIRPADHLWGKSTLDCQEAVRAELGDKNVRLAAIGPGGEKMVRFACIMNDVVHAAGRCGLGAVMGSKNLKAIAARGHNRVSVADPDKVKELARYMVTHWDELSHNMHDMGTNAGLLSLNEAGALPTRNFRDGQFEGAEKICGEALRDTISIDTSSCYACPIGCKRVVEVADDEYEVDKDYGGPEYETVGAFGSNCGIDDLRAISAANETCNAYSLDTITTGEVVSFAMECFENGLLTKEDTGGLDLHFGNAKAMVELTKMIAERKGIGNLLAEGSTRAAKQIGRGAVDFAMNVKGQPFPMHECRTRHGQALGYAVSPTGADHCHNFWDEGLSNPNLGEDFKSLGIYEPVPRTVLNTRKVYAYTVATNWTWILNHICCCMFIPWKRDQIVDIVRAITGWQVNVYELLKVSERGLNLAKVFNLREGFTRADDKLPKRMASPHLTRTVNEKPVTPEVLQQALTEYYGFMGWDPKTGVPTQTTLDALGVPWAVEYLPTT